MIALIAGIGIVALVFVTMFILIGIKVGWDAVFISLGIILVAVAVFGSAGWLIAVGIVSLVGAA